MTDFPEVVSLDRACELLGGDKPISRATLHRMLESGALEARGRGILRRVTVESIRKINTGEVVWHGAKKEPAPSNTTKRAVTSRPARQTALGQVVLLPGKKPKPR